MCNGSAAHLSFIYRHARLHSLMLCCRLAVGIAEYLQSDKRSSNFWGSGWLKQRGGKGWGQLQRDPVSDDVNIPALLVWLTLGALILIKRS